MGDPVTAAMIGSTALGGIGSIIQATGDPPMPAQMSPEMQAYLQERGLDIQQFQAEWSANLAAAKLGMELPFQQDLQVYPLKMNQALQEAYETGFGQTFGSLKDAMQGAAEGKETAYTRNLLTKMEEDIGRQYESAVQQRAQALAMAGISPDSPAYQESMAKLEREKLGETLQAERDVRLQQGERGLEQAMNWLRWGATTQRIPGVQAPEIPQTSTEKQEEQQTYKQKAQEDLNNRLRDIDAKYGSDLNVWQKMRRNMEIAAARAEHTNRLSQAPGATYIPKPGQVGPSPQDTTINPVTPNDGRGVVWTDIRTGEQVGRGR